MFDFIVRDQLLPRIDLDFGQNLLALIGQRTVVGRLLQHWFRVKSHRMSGDFRQIVCRPSVSTRSDGSLLEPAIGGKVWIRCSRGSHHATQATLAGGSRAAASTACRLANGGPVMRSRQPPLEQCNSYFAHDSLGRAGSPRPPQSQSETARSASGPYQANTVSVFKS